MGRLNRFRLPSVARSISIARPLSGCVLEGSPDGTELKQFCLFQMELVSNLFCDQKLCSKPGGNWFPCFVLNTIDFRYRVIPRGQSCRSSTCECYLTGFTLNFMPTYISSHLKTCFGYYEKIFHSEWEIFCVSDKYDRIVSNGRHPPESP